MTAIRKRSDAARRGWETRRARSGNWCSQCGQRLIADACGPTHLALTIEFFRSVLKTDELAEYARETARGLRQWSRTGCTEPGRCGMPEECMHPERVANRMDKLAERLSSSKRKDG